MSNVSHKPIPEDVWQYFQPFLDDFREKAQALAESRQRMTNAAALMCPELQDGLYELDFDRKSLVIKPTEFGDQVAHSDKND